MVCWALAYLHGWSTDDSNIPVVDTAVSVVSAASVDTVVAAGIGAAVDIVSSIGPSLLVGFAVGLEASNRQLAVQVTAGGQLPGTL